MPNSVCLKSSPAFQSFILSPNEKCGLNEKVETHFSLNQVARKWKVSRSSACSSSPESSAQGKPLSRKLSSRKSPTTPASPRTISEIDKPASRSSGVDSTRYSPVSLYFPHNSLAELYFAKRKGKDVVLDRQNFDKAQRKTWLEIANEFPNLVVSGMAMGTPYSVSPALLHSYGGD